MEQDQGSFRQDKSLLQEDEKDCGNFEGVIPIKLLQFLKFHDGEIESEDGIVLDQLAFYSWFQSSNQFSIQRSINLILKEKTECQ